uniref:Uncharacterized protein n=1 Tax=Parascaris equorum TaxID=6256 RepID=A0A914SGG4_PAREQ
MWVYQGNGVASSVAHGVGTLTFDEQHELMRRRMLRCQPQADSNSALAHLYSGWEESTWFVVPAQYVVIAVSGLLAQFLKLN